MKKIYLITVLCITVKLFSQNNIDLDHGLSLGDLGAYKSQKSNFLGGSIFGYRVLESNTGLGLSLSAATSRSSIAGYSSETLFEGINFLSLEVNWEPLYHADSFWGGGLFYRVDNIFTDDGNVDWRTGLRLDIRFNEGIIYPLMSVEAGYWENHGFYLGLKVDPLVALIGTGITLFNTTKENYDPEIIDDNTPSNDIPDWEWNPEE